jgi:hypothetical protein
MTELLLFLGQAGYSAMRSASIHGVAHGNVLLAVCMDSLQWLLMLLVLAGTLSALSSDNWLGVLCAVSGQAVGGFLALKFLNRKP